MDEELREIEVKKLKERIHELDVKRSSLLARLAELERPRDQDAASERSERKLSSKEKIAIFRKLFQGRQDVYPKRWDNQKTGRSGYSPACANEWFRGLCGKPKVKCGECPNQAFLPVTDELIRQHLTGQEAVVGVYPLLPDEQCWFLAVDFDKEAWREDTAAFLQTCHSKDVPAYVERSRSGNGGHVWVFFTDPVDASKARKLGSHLLTETMDHHPDLSFSSYDRFFPNQDTMPIGGFGNL